MFCWAKHFHSQVGYEGARRQARQIMEALTRLIPNHRIGTYATSPTCAGEPAGASLTVPFTVAHRTIIRWEIDQRLWVELTHGFSSGQSLSKYWSEMARICSRPVYTREGMSTCRVYWAFGPCSWWLSFIYRGNINTPRRTITSLRFPDQVGYIRQRQTDSAEMQLICSNSDI